MLRFFAAGGADPEDALRLREESLGLEPVFLAAFFRSSFSAASTSSFSFSTRRISVSHRLASSCSGQRGRDRRAT